MWYFSWILGLGLALTFGILNAMWYEMTEVMRADGRRPTGDIKAAR
jgi:cyd operon protein YbgT